MELDLWAGFVNRPDVRQIPPEQRLFLIEFAVAAATIEDLDIPDGFVPEVVIQFFDWPLDKATAFLDSFIERGWISRCDDPPGWEINRWLDRTTHFTPGSKETQIPAWGQKSRSQMIKRRRDSRARQMRYREKKEVDELKHP